MYILNALFTTNCLNSHLNFHRCHCYLQYKLYYLIGLREGIMNINLSSHHFVPYGNKIEHYISKITDLANTYTM